MKPLLIILSMLAFCHISYGQSITLEEARKYYSEAMKNKETCESIFRKFANVSSSENNILLGYKGAVTVAMSKYLKTAKEKMAYFNDGKKLIEEAISKDSKNVELKFIRFTIQSNCPPALKYNKNIPEDKKYIIENLVNVKNAVVRTKIKEYLLESKHTSVEEKEKIDAL